MVQRVFIYSGLPALYMDNIYQSYAHPDQVEAFYDFCRSAPLASVAKQLYDLYINPLPDAFKSSVDVQATLKQDCLGLVLEAKLQAGAWGFEITGISQMVVLKHSITDVVVPFHAVQRTARLLKDHLFYVLEDAPHSSPEAYRLFLSRVISHVKNSMS